MPYPATGAGPSGCGSSCWPGSKNHRQSLNLAASELARRLASCDLIQADLLASYDRYWNDPAWTEVLLLLTGMIPDQLAAQAISGLLDADPRWRLRSRLPPHLLLALRATAEIRDPESLIPHASALARALIGLLRDTYNHYQYCDAWALESAVCRLIGQLVKVLTPAWAGADEYLTWYQLTTNRKYVALGNLAAQPDGLTVDLDVISSSLLLSSWPARVPF